MFALWSSSNHIPINCRGLVEKNKPLKGRFTHETESMWPIHFTHSHQWKWRSWSTFASHYPWGTNKICECKMDVKSTWIPTWHRMVIFYWHLDFFQKPLLGGRPNTKLGDYGTPNTHNHCFIMFYHIWEPAWIETPWRSIWFKARSHMTSHYIIGSVTAHYMLLEVSLDGFWTQSFGLSQFHGHGSWLVCEVALIRPIHRASANGRLATQALVMG